MIRPCFFALTLVLAACSRDTSAVDAGADASPLPVEPYACGRALTCTPAEYCMTFYPGVCGGTPVDQDGMCPEGCSLCPSGTDCGCPVYECIPIPDGCAACECLDPPGGPACSCNEFGPGGVQVSCAGA